MTGLMRNQSIRRPLIALIIVSLAALSQPKEASASTCGFICWGLSCAADPHNVCRAAFGGTCGIGASCTIMDPWDSNCAMQAWYTCYGAAQ